MTALDEIIALLRPASRDELRAFTVIARRVMGVGRKQYGPTIVANDTRDFRKEGADELADYMWYVALQEVRDADRREEEAASGVDAKFDRSGGES